MDYLVDEAVIFFVDMELRRHSIDNHQKKGWKTFDFGLPLPISDLIYSGSVARGDIAASRVLYQQAFLL